MRIWHASNQQCTFFGIVHFKHTHARYPKTPLLAFLVQWYAGVARRTGNKPFGIVHFKHMLGTQRRLCWHQRCRGMRIRRVTPETHVFWHCALKTHSNHLSEDIRVAIFGANTCTFGTPHQKHTFFWHCASKTYPYQVSKDTFAHSFGTAVCVFGTPSKTDIFWHHTFQAYLY